MTKTQRLEGKYRVPVLQLQDTLLNFSRNERLNMLEGWIRAHIYLNKDDWGITGKGYEVEFELERRWYPVFVFDNIWLADKFMSYLYCATAAG